MYVRKPSRTNINETYLNNQYSELSGTIYN